MKPKEKTVLEIDKFALDIECMRQPMLYMEWSEKLSEALNQRDEAKNDLLVTQARIGQEIRQNPPKFGIDKLTEAALNEALISNENMGVVKSRLSELEYDVNILKGMKEALEQKKSMIEALVKLFISGYWAEPKVKQEGFEKLAQREVDGLSKSFKERIETRKRK